MSHNHAAPGVQRGGALEPVLSEVHPRKDGVEGPGVWRCPPDSIFPWAGRSGGLDLDVNDAEASAP